MKSIVIIGLTYLVFLLTPSFVFAQETPTPPPQVQYTNEFSVQDEPSSIISLLQNFISGFDSILGGFIFYTPNPLDSTITLKDGSQIPGVTKYRDVFNQLAIPILAIIIAGIAITKIGSDNAQQLKSFFIRFLIVIALFITVPPILSYSIQFNNLLVNQIATTQKFTSVLDEYLTKSSEAINEKNVSSESYGIPSFDFSLIGGVLKSLGKFIVEIMLFALTFIFLLCGFIFIGFQFVIRFASLLFLGVLYPVVLPFALSERTEGIVHTYFKSWFTFLIEQPAFVLGFAIANDIFISILKSQGPSVGMLFFYTGFLFFLGSVNMLVAKLFGDVWTAMSGNMYAALSYRTVSGSMPVQQLNRGLSAGVSKTISAFTRSKDTKSLTESTQGNGKTNLVSTGSNGTASIKQKPSNGNTKQSRFSEALAGKGLQVESQNEKQGVVSVSGDAYRFQDKKSGLVSYYPTRLEAIEDGVSEDKLERVSFDNKQFIDLSSFGKTNPNPHNFNAMEESKRKGKELNYAFITQSSPPKKVKNFLEIAQKRNDAIGVSGVIVERQAKNGTDPVIRMYSHKNYEKRKNI